MDFTKFRFLALALIMFIHFFLVGCACAITLRNLTTDQQALLQFKHRITDPHNILTNNWTIASSVCNWVGVSCAAKHKRVRALNLPDMGLTATVIPPHIGNLSFLVSLNLSGNNFHGDLPRELGKLSRLKHIELSFNFLSGEIPTWFGRLDEVLYLYLRNNGFTGTIPQSISNMSNLKILDLRYNLIHGHIPLEISNLQNLRILRLAYNQLSGEIPWEIGNLRSLEIFSAGEMRLVGQIPDSIFNIPSLREIYCNQNNLSGSLPEDICHHLPNLEVLNLYSNEFSGQIPSAIDQCRNLQNLSLDSNRFTGNIPRTIGNLTRLKFLYLGNNYLEGEIPWEIGNLRSLELFSAFYMRLVGPIPASIFNISSLKVLSFYNNSLSGKLPYMIPASNLQELYLGHNNLSGNIPDSLFNASKLTNLELQNNSFSGLIPNKLGHLRFLEVLRLWSNNLTAETSNGEFTFFSSLATCRHLKVLELAFNPLNGILPRSISNLSTSLQKVHLEGCKIRGIIPMEIGNLNSVISIYLSSNELSGSIPTTIGRLKNLQLLSAQENKLRGSILHDLCGLKQLYHLSLSANELDGPLPSCFSDLTSLRYLYLASNKLNSTIPLSFWSLKDILIVDLSSNYLSGSLPPDIGNLKVLTNLYLSGNFLSSGIPSSFGSLVDLQDLDLSSNRFQGHIPESLGYMVSLESLNLSKNHLSGVIPKFLERLSHLSYFDVSFNGLEGEIPSGGPFVNFTAKSFMNNYALCGSPTLQVQPCKNNIHQSNMTLLHVLIYVLPIFASIIIVVALIIIYRKKQHRSRNLEIGEDFSGEAKWRRITYYQLMQGADGFSESNLLGSGSFGSVYKGVLPDGTNVAIKVFNLQIAGSFRSFDVECEVMGNILHRNLVKVISCCSNVDFKALVLEFMPNGSLEKWLYSFGCFLDILQRINIMIDVASALEYLHLGHPNPIIHCDLKPSNVLLDEDMVAHVGDFGLAKLMGEEDSVKQTITLATIGYMAPEYGLAGIISVKSDIYSYGILLMEVFTRKKPTDEIFSGEMTIKHWIKTSLSNGISGIVDSNLVHEDDEHFVIKSNCVSSIMELALDCSTESPDDRMETKHVVSRLQNIKRRIKASSIIICILAPNLNQGIYVPRNGTLAFH
ncbi:hypothetical protein PTKIN_Ptkin14bG0123800 [Pterospermum kingtungense]